MKYPLVTLSGVLILSAVSAGLPNPEEVLKELRLRETLGPTEGRIVDGHDCTEPYATSFQYWDTRSEVGWRHICTAVLLTPDLVMTAGHCCYLMQTLDLAYSIIDPGRFRYRICANSATIAPLSEDAECVEYSITDTCIPPGFSYKRCTHDACTMRMPHKFTKVDPRHLPLPPNCKKYPNVPAGAKVTVAGWGSTSTDPRNSTLPNHLQCLKAEVICRSECQETYLGHPLGSDVFCTVGEPMGGTCGGDSGGPVVAEIDGAKYLVGIVSFGIKNACGLQGVPDGQLDICSINDWFTCQLNRRPSLAKPSDGALAAPASLWKPWNFDGEDSSSEEGCRRNEEDCWDDPRTCDAETVCKCQNVFFSG